LFNPETQVVASRIEGGEYVYIVQVGTTQREVVVPEDAFARVTPGALGAPMRRKILAEAVRREFGNV
jgi:hypothetical protein